jgi:hypothetical protein
VKIRVNQSKSNLDHVRYVRICADMCGYVRFLAEKGSGTNAEFGVRSAERGNTEFACWSSTLQHDCSSCWGWCSAVAGHSRAPRVLEN